MRLAATSLTTAMQMVANGDGRRWRWRRGAQRDGQVLRFAAPQPGRSISYLFRLPAPRASEVFHDLDHGP
jgi:hypothetical protein